MSLLGHDLVNAAIPSDYVPVTASDANDLPASHIIGLYIEGAGDVAVRGQGGVTRTIAVPDNFYLTGNFARVLSTGTTATGIFALTAKS